MNILSENIVVDDIADYLYLCSCAGGFDYTVEENSDLVWAFEHAQRPVCYIKSNLCEMENFEVDNLVAKIMNRRATDISVVCFESFAQVDVLSRYAGFELASTKYFSEVPTIDTHGVLPYSITKSPDATLHELSIEKYLITEDGSTVGVALLYHLSSADFLEFSVDGRLSLSTESKMGIAGSIQQEAALILIDGDSYANNANTIGVLFNYNVNRPTASFSNTSIVPALPLCGVLKSDTQYEYCTQQTEALGLPKHPDTPKNWDTLGAFSAIINSKKINTSDSILDAGGEYYSAILSQLESFGYNNLTAINLVFNQPSTRGKINYEFGDIAKTRFEDDTFSFITCLSVIEHGVDVESFLIEAKRILKKGGRLFVSTDYWDSPIDTKGQYAYNCPIKIFNSAEIKAMIDFASRNGFRLAEPFDFTCDKKTVHWVEYDLRYTFIYFILIKH